MAPKLLVGKEIGERIRAELKKEIEGSARRASYQVSPSFSSGTTPVPFHM